MRENIKNKEDDNKDFRIQYQSKLFELNEKDKYQREKAKIFPTMFTLIFDILI